MLNLKKEEDLATTAAWKMFLREHLPTELLISLFGCNINHKNVKNTDFALHPSCIVCLPLYDPQWTEITKQSNWSQVSRFLDESSGPVFKKENKTKNKTVLEKRRKYEANTDLALLQMVALYYEAQNSCNVGGAVKKEG